MEKLCSYLYIAKHIPELLQGSSAEKRWNGILIKLNEAIDKYVPMCRSKSNTESNKHKGFPISMKLKVMIKMKEKLRYKYNNKKVSKYD